MGLVGCSGGVQQASVMAGPRRVYGASTSSTGNAISRCLVLDNLILIS